MWKRILIWITGILVLGLIAFVIIEFLSDPSYPAAWVKSYNYSAANNSYNEAVDITTDSFGNIYVTGYSSGNSSNDYYTVKYSPDGEEVWAKRYDGFLGGDDKAQALCLDSSNAVYLTGYSEGNITYDITTVKYSSNGEELWVSRYDGPSGRGDQASDIAVDDQGNIVITGYTTATEKRTDYITIKYDNNGNELWTAQYDGPKSDRDCANAIAIDSSGSVYVTGYSYGNNTAEDFATIKYDDEGNQLWIARYDGPAHDYDEAKSILVDSSGNIYVTGYTTVEKSLSKNNVACTTIKYDTNGTQLWVKQYARPEGGQASALDIAADEQGNVYITGDSSYRIEDFATSDTLTIKYDTNGNEEWIVQYNSPEKLQDGANAIALDQRGNVYIAGSSAGIGSSADFLTIKYNNEGELVWFSKYNSPSSLRDTANAITVDDTGNVYVAGYAYTSAKTTDFVTIKYAPEEP